MWLRRFSCLPSRRLANAVLRSASENVFVLLIVGGGIRDFTDGNDRRYSSLEVASEYSGKVWKKQLGTDFQSLWEPGIHLYSSDKPLQQHHPIIVAAKKETSAVANN
ncbi:hypothetical protein LOK49_LG08G02789 [Camellia lanceoleosa]|uniref:Uncharacterized protein n=1 Tax=Camellia lanceoleosa TaxID=1840588 RepID=A0ACC0GXI2_9ERIC|nr:hypothetical protein LOK49_LG08G02789 [Camellia lanceoleosa]